MGFIHVNGLLSSVKLKQIQSKERFIQDGSNTARDASRRWPNIE